MSGFIDITWKSPGSVADRFMASTARTQIINGPIGSGKTTAVLMKGIHLAAAQRRSTRDGVRKFKLCIVRDTYRQLWKTTIPSWFKRVPKEVGEFIGADGAPAKHRVKFGLGDGSKVDLQVEFVAIGENAVEDVLRGYEPTAFYLNEADLLAREVWDFADGRVGRYPDMDEGGPSWRGVLMDCNAPELGSWLYDDVFTKSAEELAAGNIDLFRQPSGLSAEAENIANLDGGAGYYHNQALNKPAWYVARMLENKPGYSRAGKPVYPEFNDALHVPAGDLEPVKGIRLIGGLDAGLRPAAMLCQHMPSGQWRGLDELVTEPGVGPRRFGQRLNLLLSERYAGFDVVFYADPAAQHGQDKAAEELSWLQIVEEEIGFPVLAAPTNSIIRRLESVRLPLTRLIDGQPGFLLSSRCKVIRSGFNAGYRFRKLNISGADRYGDEIDKNDFSHPHDALQYALSGGGEDLAVMYRHERNSGQPRQRTAISEEGGGHGRQRFAIGDR